MCFMSIYLINIIYIHALYLFDMRECDIIYIAMRSLLIYTSLVSLVYMSSQPIVHECELFYKVRLSIPQDWYRDNSCQ